MVRKLISHHFFYNPPNLTKVPNINIVTPIRVTNVIWIANAFKDFGDKFGINFNLACAPSNNVATKQISLIEITVSTGLSNWNHVLIFT